MFQQSRMTEVPIADFSLQGVCMICLLRYLEEVVCYTDELRLCFAQKATAQGAGGGRAAVSLGLWATLQAKSKERKEEDI